VFQIENLSRFPPDDKTARAAFDDQLDLACLEFDRGDAFGRGDDELVARRRVCVLVKVETCAARIAREPDDAMAGFGLDPFNRRFHRMGRRRLRDARALWL